MRGALRLEQRQIAGKLQDVAETIFLPDQQRLACQRIAVPLRTGQQSRGLGIDKIGLLVAELVKLPSFFELADTDQQRCKRELRVRIVRADGDSLPVRRLGLRQAVEFLQYVTEVIERLDEI